MAKKNPAVLWNVDQTGDVIGSTGRATAQGNIGLGSTIVTPAREGKKFITHISRIGTPGTGEVAGELKANLDDVRLADIAATPTDATRSVVTDNNGKMTSMSMKLGSSDKSDENTKAIRFVSSIDQSAQGKVTYITEEIRAATDDSAGSNTGITALTTSLGTNVNRTTSITTAATPTGVWSAIDSAIGALTLDQVTQNLLSSSTDAAYPVILKYSTATSGSVTNTVNYASGVTVNPKDASITAGKFLSTSGTYTCDLDGNGLQLSNSGSAGTLVAVGGITTGTGTFTSNCRIDGTLHVGNDTTGMYVDIDTNGLAVKNAQRPTAVTTLTDDSIKTTGTAAVYGDCWVGGKLSEGAKSGEVFTGEFIEINNGVISSKNYQDGGKQTTIEYNAIATSGSVTAAGRRIDGWVTETADTVYTWPDTATHLLLTANADSDVTLDLANLKIGYVYWLHFGKHRKVGLKNSSANATIYVYNQSWATHTTDTTPWWIYDRTSDHGNPAVPIIKGDAISIYVMMYY